MIIVPELECVSMGAAKAWSEQNTASSAHRARLSILDVFCRVSESAAGAIQHVHESRWYKILLPLVAPLADPAVKRIMNSPAFQVLSGTLHHICLIHQASWSYVLR